jgi:hypothetical protein
MNRRITLSFNADMFMASRRQHARSAGMTSSRSRLVMLRNVSGGGRPPTRW